MKLHILILSFLILNMAMYCCTIKSENMAMQNNLDSLKSTNYKGQQDGVQNYFIDIRDGKEYKIVKIGSQTWFAENLTYKPNSGDYWAYDDNESNITKFGYLYFWETAINACPAGWHLPTKEEWITLTNFLGGKSVAGIELKATNDWNVSNKEATNRSGFSVLPGGNRSVGGPYYHLGNDGLFWSSTSKGSRSAWEIRFNYNWDSVGFQACSHLTGLSVRCVKD